MKIICGEVGAGKTNELLKMFLEDTNTAIFLSDEEGLDNIVERIKHQENGVKVIDFQGKEIKTNMFVNCNSDYYIMILKSISSHSIYLNLCIPLDFKKQFKEFCSKIEKEYCLNIVMTEQLICNSGLKGIKIVEFE